MAKKAPWTLHILWRAEGEQRENFTTESEANHRKYTLDGLYGTRIIKMDVVQNK